MLWRILAIGYGFEALGAILQAQYPWAFTGGAGLLRWTRLVLARILEHVPTVLKQFARRSAATGLRP